MEKVSIVMPAYNSEKYIRESIDSVVNQTYGNWELVIVNDGSIDTTIQILLEYTNKYPDKIKIIDKKKNEGISKGLNDAIKKAEGTYICWLSSDDVYVPDMIESEIDYLDNNKEYDIVFSNYDLIDHESNFLMSSPKLKFFEELKEGNREQPYKSLLSKYCLNGCSVMCKKEHYNKVGGFDPQYVYAHDYDMWIRLAAAYKIGFINKINVHYRIHPQQGTNLGFNDLDSIKSLFNFMKDENSFSDLALKANIPVGIEGQLIVMENLLIRFKGRKREFDLLYNESIKFIKYYCKKHIKNEQELFENKLFRKMEMINQNMLIPYENFFETGSYYNWSTALCDNQNLDGFIINNEGARFERFSDNDMNRLCMGIKYDNLIIKKTMTDQEINNIIGMYEKDIKWYLKKKLKPVNTIGFSYYMINDEKFKCIFDNENFEITNQDIWNAIMNGILSHS
jgi:Glycosyltransferases, probably involved in cell wall biogenesis